MRNQKASRFNAQESQSCDPTLRRCPDNELVRNILLATMASLAKLESEKISLRVKAGLERARKKGVKLGRKPVAPEIEQRVRVMHAGGLGMLKIAEKLKIGSGTVQRILRAA